MKTIKIQLPNHLKPPSSLATKSYNAQINRYAAANAHRHVIFLYFTMLKTNILPDPYTYPSMLKACTSLNLFSHGISFHQHAITNGCSSDAYIGASLINFYAKFGYTDVAHKVFDVMPERNVVPWTAIIGCYTRSKDVDTALKLYNQMQCEGVNPSSVTLLTMVSGVTKDTHVQSFHACVIQYGFCSDLALLNCMISSYGKCGRLSDAKNLFESMEKRDIVSWNSLISVCSLTDNVEEISQLLSRMCLSGFDPDYQAFGSLISTVTRLGNPHIGKIVHGKIAISGFEANVKIKTALLQMYLKFKDVKTACKVYKSTPDKDMILYTTMISGLLQNECPDKALASFNEMLISKVRPSTTTLACALAACAGIGSFNIGTSIHGYMLRQKMLLDVPTQNSLITMYAKCGRLNQSCFVFDMMNDKDVVTWNAMVAGYAQNGQFDNALYIFNEMRKSFERPDSVTVVSLLQACASTGAHLQGKCIHNFVIRSCFRSCLLIDTALVDMYFKCGNIDNARTCFDLMSEHDVVSWSTMIAGYGSHGKGEKALEMFLTFLNSGFEPNHVTFLSVLYACSHNGLVDEGIRLFETMVNRYKIEPRLEHCACVIDLLCRAGRIEHAYELYKNMFCEPVVDVLGILLDACTSRGNKVIGDVIGDEIRKLKVEDAGNLVQLVHSYASVGKWEGVGEAWLQMRSLGVKKVPAWSFVELNGNTTTFYKDHSSHPEYEDIVMCLKSVTMHSKPRKTYADSLECDNF
ncbi:pentatricopeptide repeat-containing protein At4g04370 [Rutidosis leptorrhynchoides]|uniref:pentatricopeptide repeat-containing protein At4g04370 n=1 Tax=Rutidosis leptorrhynchoides TaxID=125765 RepID=UPI003A99F501